jgi:hypothetical protein
VTYDGNDRREQWYTNRDIYEMVMSLRDELKKTQDVVVKYNGIRTDLNKCMTKMLEYENRAVGRYSVGQAIREWGGWLFALAIVILRMFGAV